MSQMTGLEALVDIQSRLVAPKDQYNSFSKFNYRSCEGILAAVKPLCKEHNALLLLSDEIVSIGDRFYVEATATFECNGFTRSVKALAREPVAKKGMDECQITGTASSYARKYALNGLFDIDDTKDADTDEYRMQTQERQAERELERKSQETISSDQVVLLRELAKDKGVEESAIVDRFKVRSLEELTKKQFVTATRNLEATERKRGA